jgi:hypothetical protein
LTEEQQPQEEKPKKKVGRHKSPDWERLVPLERYYTKLDLLTRKFTKKIPPGIVDVLKLEAMTLGIIYPGSNLHPTQEEIDEAIEKRQEIVEERSKLIEPQAEETPKFKLNLDDV